MERVQEPSELMSEDAQARAYAEADFEAPHSEYVRQFSLRFPDYQGTGAILDLGCGPADITCRFALRYPSASLCGVDGSAAMLGYGRRLLSEAGADVAERITLIEGFIPGVKLPVDAYDVIVCNNLLHHLPDPQALWTTIKAHSRVGTRVFVADLYRPAREEAAREIVETYSAHEPEVLKTDFYNSLLAAFTPTEIEAQLSSVALGGFSVHTLDDRHVLISGMIG